MNAYSTAYNLLYRARNVLRVIAKLAAWFTGIPAVFIGLWASSLGKPIIAGNPYAIRFMVALAAVYILPRLFDFAMRRVVAAARRHAAAGA
jgi:hypothetical protein